MGFKGFNMISRFLDEKIRIQGPRIVVVMYTFQYIKTRPSRSSIETMMKGPNGSFLLNYKHLKMIRQSLHALGSVK